MNFFKINETIFSVSMMLTKAYAVNIDKYLLSVFFFFKFLHLVVKNFFRR